MNELRLLAFFALLLTTFGLAACQTETAIVKPVGETKAAVREIESPAQINSHEPELFATEREVLLSWVEGTKETGHTLRFAAFTGDRWSEPKTVANGANWFVNWADFPTIMRLPDNSLIAHWLVTNAAKKYAYDVFVARSDDNGANWSKPVRPHTDNTATEHGFVSLLPWTNDKAAVVWLDGRKFKDQHHAKSNAQPEFIKAHHQDEIEPEMTLRAAAIDKNGRLSDEAELDSRTCDCCQTAAAQTENGAIVVYRDRDQEEVRDISIVRFANGAWTKPQTLARDNWQINACPVNGPALAALGKTVAVAWFTAADETPKVKLVFSKDAGATFGAPIEITGGSNAGRVDVALLKDHSAMVIWLDGAGSGTAIRARRVFSNGTQSEPLTVAQTTAQRSGGFPRIAALGDKVVFAWTESLAKDQPTRVRTAIVELN